MTQMMTRQSDCAT